MHDIQPQNIASNIFVDLLQERSSIKFSKIVDKERIIKLMIAKESQF